MFSELEVRSARRVKWLPHPKIPFVHVYGKKYLCIDHKLENLNKGSMRQHVEGKQHAIDFDTGIPLSEIGKTPEKPAFEIKEEPVEVPELHEPPEEKNPLESAVNDASEEITQETVRKIRDWPKIRKLESMGYPEKELNEYRRLMGFMDNSKDKEAEKNRYLSKFLIMNNESDPAKQLILAYYFFDEKQRDNLFKMLTAKYLASN